jgi:hypothetical protein
VLSLHGPHTPAALARRTGSERDPFAAGAALLALVERGDVVLVQPHDAASAVWCVDRNDHRMSAAIHRCHRDDVWRWRRARYVARLAAPKEIDR